MDNINQRKKYLEELLIEVGFLKRKIISGKMKKIKCVKESIKF